MRGRRAAFIAAGVLAALGLLAPIARAHGEGVELTAPAAFGTVDFGDTVEYRLKGVGCAGETVTLRVVTPGETLTSSSNAVQLGEGVCAGRVTVPDEAAVRGAGWDSGQALPITLTSAHGQRELRYQRVEVDLGQVAAGAPVVQAASEPDPRADGGDEVLSMSTGDVVSVGWVDLSRIYSVSLRVCLTNPKPHATPSIVELRAGEPDAPSIIGRVDVADDLNNSNKSNFGWPNCWQLQPWPIINQPPGHLTELFLAMVATAAPVEISYIDFNGTGAKVPDAWSPDPAGMSTIFNGNLTGWSHENCVVEPDGSVHGAHTTSPGNYAPLATFGFQGEPGCSMTYGQDMNDVLIRLEYRMQHFADNGGVFVGGREIQMREAGEWMTGGLLGTTLPDALTNWAKDNPATGYPAERIKSNSHNDWSLMEILLVGSRYMVRVNGRTVTDCADCFPDPGAFKLRLASQPSFSYHYGAGFRMDTGPTNPTFGDPSNWGNLSFRNVRVHPCGADDSVCAPLRSVRG